tara:strand:- start:20255 stop:21397 length:1143 start_codon:yes stop_codon:yes gene_type:complete
LIKRILVFSGSRGEWGYLKPILNKLKSSKIDFKIVVSNMHLLPEKGFTYKEILSDGFKIYENIYMNINGPDDIAWSKSLGLLNFQLPDIFKRLKPDLLLIAGDRAETFIAATSAYYSDIPIAHIQAGERSGHKDGMVRHAIGKLSHIHFASNLDAVNRLKKFGEEKFRIFLVGAPQLDDISPHKLLLLDQINNALSSSIKNNYALCIVHPTSENKLECINYVKIISESCHKKNIQQIWIYPNNDSGSAGIIKEIEKITARDIFMFRNLKRSIFLSLLARSKFIIGNSSAGILEAPSFKIPTINLGHRQRDRVAAESIINIIKPSKTNVINNIKTISSMKMRNKFKKVKNPYGDGKSASRIVKILETIKLDNKLRNKFIEE